LKAVFMCLPSGDTRKQPLRADESGNKGKRTNAWRPTTRGRMVPLKKAKKKYQDDRGMGVERQSRRESSAEKKKGKGGVGAV